MKKYQLNFLNDLTNAMPRPPFPSHLQHLLKQMLQMLKENQSSYQITVFLSHGTDWMTECLLCLSSISIHSKKLKLHIDAFVHFNFLTQAGKIYITVS